MTSTKDLATEWRCTNQAIDIAAKCSKNLGKISALPIAYLGAN